MASTADTAQSESLAARPTSSAFGGKCTARLSALVPEEFALEFQRFALKRGYPSTSDCMREILFIAVLGQEMVATLHRERIEQAGIHLAGIGTERAR